MIKGHSGSYQKCFRAVERIDAGITYVNAPTIGAEIYLPFGGTKASGNGTREAGTTALDEFTDLKTVYFRLQRPAAKGADRHPGGGNEKIGKEWHCSASNTSIIISLH